MKEKPRARYGERVWSFYTLLEGAPLPAPLNVYQPGSFLKTPFPLSHTHLLGFYGGFITYAGLIK